MTIVDSRQDRSGLFASLHDEGGLSEAIASQLRHAIVEGTLATDQSLHEVSLAEDFGTSRTPVREALRILEGDGLVTLVPRRGAVVRSTSVSEIADIYLSRAYLYGLAARLASLRRDDVALQQFEKLRTKLSESVTASNEREYFDVLVQFNDLLVEVSGNVTLSQLLRPLKYISLRLRYQSIHLPGRPTESLERYVALVDAIRAQHGRAAEREIRKAIALSGEALLLHYCKLDANDERIRMMRNVWDD